MISNEAIRCAIEAGREINPVTASLLEELLARRAADEGAVVVEGWARNGFLQGTPIGELGIEDVRSTRAEDWTEPVWCEVRRRSVDPAGGEG